MRRSSFITWDQLKVGVLILVALVILAFAIIKLGQAGNLFGKRYKLVAFIGNASGLRIGGPVTVAGQLSGSIKDIKFLPPDADTNRNLKLIVEVDRDVTEQVRRDSRGKIRTQGVLGDKVFDISPGTPPNRVLHEGDTVAVDPSVATAHSGHGIVMPQCNHGGPGRAGAGEELGGLHGLRFYHQRLAVQGSSDLIASLQASAASVH